VLPVKKNLFIQMIKKTSLENPNDIVSAYKDNVAFVKGPRVEQFAKAQTNLIFIK
jgi:phosphoribosylformylglycinamidine synthase